MYDNYLGCIDLWFVCMYVYTCPSKVDRYPYLGDLLIMVINHLLNGMILQVVRIRST